MPGGACWPNGAGPGPSGKGGAAWTGAGGWPPCWVPAGIKPCWPGPPGRGSAASETATNDRSVAQPQTARFVCPSVDTCIRGNSCLRAPPLELSWWTAHRLRGKVHVDRVFGMLLLRLEKSLADFANFDGSGPRPPRCQHFPCPGRWGCCHGFCMLLLPAVRAGRRQGAITAPHVKIAKRRQCQHGHLGVSRHRPMHDLLAFGAVFGPTGFALRRRLAYRLPPPVALRTHRRGQRSCDRWHALIHRGFPDETDFAPGPVRGATGCVGVPPSSSLPGALLDAFARLCGACLPARLPSGGAKRPGNVRAVMSCRTVRSHKVAASLHCALA